MGVGAGDHTIPLLVLDVVVSLGFCTLINFHYILRLNYAH